jgi:hypothetical protein
LNPVRSCFERKLTQSGVTISETKQCGPFGKEKEWISGGCGKWAETQSFELDRDSKFGREEASELDSMTRKISIWSRPSHFVKHSKSV